jgi:hypothetical protein
MPTLRPDDDARLQLSVFPLAVSAHIPSQYWAPFVTGVAENTKVFVPAIGLLIGVAVASTVVGPAGVPANNAPLTLPVNPAVI